MDILVYIFKIVPGNEFLYYIPVLVFAGLMIIGGFAIKYFCKTNKACRRVLQHSSSNFISLGGIILILVGARYEEIPFISMRFLLGLTLAISIYLIIKTIIKIKKDYPLAVTQIESHQHKPEKSVYTHSKKKH